MTGLDKFLFKWLFLTGVCEDPSCYKIDVMYLWPRNSSSMIWKVNRYTDIAQKAKIVTVLGKWWKNLHFPARLLRFIVPTALCVKRNISPPAYTYRYISPPVTYKLVCWIWHGTAGLRHTIFSQVWRWELTGWNGNNSKGQADDLIPNCTRLATCEINVLSVSTEGKALVRA